MYPARLQAPERSGALLLRRAMSWDQRFFDPIMLPGRDPLATVRDAAVPVGNLIRLASEAESRNVSGL